MKKIITIISFVLICVFHLRAQSLETNIAKVLTHDETLLTFNNKEGSCITSILASGSVKFTSTTGNVRVLISDNNGYEKLVYESFPSLVSQDGMDNFELMALETDKIKDYVPNRIYVQISDAEIYGLKIIVSGLNNISNLPSISLCANTKTISPVLDIGSTEEQKRIYFINHLNKNLESSGALWRAGDTPFSRLSYEEKKEMYGGTVPNFNGAEYYTGGVFDVDNCISDAEQNNHSNYVPDFDWRMRHNATVKGSPYFQNEITGWITPVKDQGSCGSCWAFSAIGAMEAIAKFERNATYNFNLSEQELVSCSNAGNCTGGSIISALDYISKNRIQDDMSFKYKAMDLPCSKKGNPLYTIKNTGFTVFNSTDKEFTSIEKLKSMLIQSPLAGRIGAWSHAMTLVGYKTIKAGDVVYENATTRITVKPEDSHIGKTVWIFKNSWGENWGDHGFLYAFAKINNLTNSVAPTLPFEYKYNTTNSTYILPPNISKVFTQPVCAYDRDNDGYYWWGIGPRPNNLPADAKLEEDCDDSDASVGPMNQYGFPILLKDYDLYIKDNEEDMGFEPNTTITNNNFWSAPQVWVRHNPDSILEHQNPICDNDNYIYARVWNRGKKKSPESRLSGYWAKAGTNLQWPEAWTGIMTIDNIPVGGHIPELGTIPPLEPGEYADVQIKWSIPKIEKFSTITNEAVGGKDSWHFCLLLKIADKNDGLTYPEVSDIYEHVSANNNVVQKNVTLVKSENSFSYEGAVSVINHLSHKEAYSIDVIEIPKETNVAMQASNVSTPNNTTLFNDARVQLRMAPQVLTAWTEGGKRCVNVRQTSNPHVQEIVSSNGSLENIILPPKDIGLVKLSVNFQTVLPEGSKPEKHIILLRQKDKTGKVIGGETFEIIREPRPVIRPHIKEERNEGTVTLAVTGVDEDATYQWFDSEEKMIADGATITCSPQKDETYKVEVTAKKDGYLTSSEILVKQNKGRVVISPIPVKSELILSYDLPVGEYELCISGAQNQINYGKYSLDYTKNRMQINVSTLPNGIYIATITERNGLTKETLKFIKE